MQRVTAQDPQAQSAVATRLDVAGSTIVNSYAHGTVTSAGRAVGFIAYTPPAPFAQIDRCYANTAVHGPGFIDNLGGSDGGFVTSSYYDSQKSGTATNAAAAARTTAAMQMQSTFSGWDFTGVWKLAPSDSPRLIGVDGP